ncbi:MAG: relaxase/mobilization nuclease domain-containing protein, partial [Oscillospiraceae bacterium]|nr:relaxase/mobilization nuclease domain-containing protein [Oscillospiraceae bacterium]
MAIVKPINSGASLEISINYVLRTDKTETRLTSGLYCIPEIALEQMNETKELWVKTDGRQYKHFVQSFPANDEVSAETIHTIGVRFAEKMFPDFEVLISTHKDKEHCHTHFIVNSVNFETGLKIQNSYHDLKAMRDYSDELCRQH